MMLFGISCLVLLPIRPECPKLRDDSEAYEMIRGKACRFGVEDYPAVKAGYKMAEKGYVQNQIKPKIKNIVCAEICIRA